MSAINFSGLASGIDSAGIIDSLTKQRRQSRVTPLTKLQSRSEDTLSALSELKSLVRDLAADAGSFRVINGGGIAKRGESSNETVLLAETKSGTNSGRSEITVNQLARNGSISFNDRFTSPNQAVASNIDNNRALEEREITFTVGEGGETENIKLELNSTTTLTNLRDSFNSSSNKATASIVNVGSSSNPSYALSITSKSSGVTAGKIEVNVGNAITDSGKFQSSNLVQARDSIIRVAGIDSDIARPTNSIDDVLEGVTLNLKSLGLSTVSVETNNTETVKRVKKFVDSLNSVLSYATENDKITLGGEKGDVTNSFGTLSETSIDENLVTAVKSTLSSSKNSSSMILADIGIKTARDGTFELDEKKLTETLNSNPSGVGTLLESVGEKLSSVNGVLSEYTKFQGMFDQSDKSIRNEISNRQRKIDEIELGIDKERKRLQDQFTRLEKFIAGLNSQQNALSSLFR
jgi:flagellar hook-associated protein 2